MSNGGIEFRHNRLPQWRLDGGVYFITWRLNDQTDMLSPEERTIVADCIRFHKDKRYLLSIFVVMDDHVHMLVQALPGHDMSKTLKVIKGYTARMINASRGVGGTRWQKASHTELLGNDAAIEGCRQYIYNNPQARWGSPSHEYPWLGHYE